METEPTPNADDILAAFAMDKSRVSVACLSEPSDEREYWLGRTPEERLAALELMRVMAYGYDPATERLQRVLTVARLGES